MIDAFQDNYRMEVVQETDLYYVQKDNKKCFENYYLQNISFPNYCYYIYLEYFIGGRFQIHPFYENHILSEEEAMIRFLKTVRFPNKEIGQYIYCQDIIPNDIVVKCFNELKKDKANNNMDYLYKEEDSLAVYLKNQRMGEEGQDGAEDKDIKKEHKSKISYLIEIKKRIPINSCLDNHRQKIIYYPNIEKQHFVYNFSIERENNGNFSKENIDTYMVPNLLTKQNVLSRFFKRNKDFNLENKEDIFFTDYKLPEDEIRYSYKCWQNNRDVD